VLEKEAPDDPACISFISNIAFPLSKW